MAVDRVDALQQLIQQKQIDFFDALASHPERQQDMITMILQSHREDLAETATEQFADVPESARNVALDLYIQNLQTQLRTYLVGLAGNQLINSPYLEVNDYRTTLLYVIATLFFEKGYEIGTYVEFVKYNDAHNYHYVSDGKYDPDKRQLKNIHRIDVERTKLICLRDACHFYRQKEGTVVIISVRTKSSKKSIIKKERKFFGGFREHHEEITVPSRLLAHLFFLPDQPIVFYVVDENFREQARMIANSIAAYFQTNIILRT